MPITDYIQDNLQSLSLITKRKLNRTIQSLRDKCSCEGIGCRQCGPIIEGVERYYYANIPVDYWFLDMKNFHGAEILKNKYNNITNNIDETYDKGLAINFAGKHGCGKTLSAVCILKRALEKGYSGYYTNLDAIVSYLTSYNQDRIDVKSALQSVDFLVIDEFDPRFMGTNNAAELFGRILEPIFRNRVQNNYPLIMCTNSPNVVGGFEGALKESLTSLMHFVDTIPVVGKDFRETYGKKA